MIKHLAIRNFQRHEVLDLDLEPGVNVIVGRSGTGKSSVIRALRWLVFNRPLGEVYRRWGSGETLVEVETQAGNTVTRLKSNKENLYRLNGREVFRSFGQNPPEAIAKALNLGAINFQQQHDPLFLLSMSEAELSKALNEVAGLDDIDRSRSRVNSMMVRHRLEVSSTKSLRDKLKEEVETYAGLDELEVECKVLDNLAEQENRERVKANSLFDLANRIAEVSSDLSRYKTLPKAEKSLKVAFEALNEASVLETHSKGISTLAAKLSEARRGVALYRQAAKASKTVEGVSTALGEAQAMGARADEIDLMLVKLKSLRSERDSLAIEHNQLHTEFDKLMPEECPLCGSVVKKQK